MAQENTFLKHVSGTASTTQRASRALYHEAGLGFNTHSAPLEM